MNSSRIIFFCLTACAFLNAALREIIQLFGGWSFQIDVSDIGEKEQWYGNNFDRSAWAKVSVPKAWDLYDEALTVSVGMEATERLGWATGQAYPPPTSALLVYPHSKRWLNRASPCECQNADPHTPFLLRHVPSHASCARSSFRPSWCSHSFSKSSGLGPIGLRRNPVVK
jgi:hypothetical protein